MKKTFTLIIALVATVSMMAQTYTFEGKSSYSATIMGITAQGGSDHDTLVVANIDAKNLCSDISIPAMTVSVMGNNMTVPAMTLTKVPFTMTGMGKEMIINWKTDEGQELVYQVMDDGKEKTVKISNLTGSFSRTTNTMSLSFDMQYGSMPGTLSFTETDAALYTPGATDITEASTASPKYSVRKVLVNGKVVIINSENQYNTVGTLLK